MVRQGMVVAIGSDFCPNAHCLSMPLAMHLACRNFGLTIPEAITAATLNSAYALCREDSSGSIEAGKWANFVVLDGGY